MQREILLGLMMSWIVWGCAEKPDPVAADNLVNFDVTYDEHIKPLMETYCTGCHASARQGAARKGAPAGIDFDSYEATRNAAQAANRRIQSDSMPPGMPKLSDNEKALFATWLEQGLTE